MAVHAEYPLRRPRISKIFDLFLAVPTSKAAGTECLVSCQDSEIFDLVPTRAAAVCTIVADEGSVAEEEEVRIGVEQSAAGITSKAVDVPSVTSCEKLATLISGTRVTIPSSNAFPSSRIYRTI